MDSVGKPPTPNLNTYTYAQDNPVSNIDPSGLWSLSVEGYFGAGGGILFGYDETAQQWFWGGRLGYGLGGGASFDTAGGRPGGENNDGYCGSGTTVGDFVSLTPSVGPIQYPASDAHGGYDFGTGKPYHEKPALPDHVTFGHGEGVDLGGWILHWLPLPLAVTGVVLSEGIKILLLEYSRRHPRATPGRRV